MPWSSTTGTVSVASPSSAQCRRIPSIEEKPWRAAPCLPNVRAREPRPDGRVRGVRRAGEGSADPLTLAVRVLTARRTRRLTGDRLPDRRRTELHAVIDSANARGIACDTLDRAPVAFRRNGTVQANDAGVRV